MASILPKIIKTDQDVDEMARYTKEMLKKAHEAGQEGITIKQSIAMTDLEKLQKVFQEIGIKYFLFIPVDNDERRIDIEKDAAAEAHFVFDVSGKFKRYWAE